MWQVFTYIFIPFCSFRQLFRYKTLTKMRLILKWDHASAVTGIFQCGASKGSSARLLKVVPNILPVISQKKIDTPLKKVLLKLFVLACSQHLFVKLIVIPLHCQRFWVVASKKYVSHTYNGVTSFLCLRCASLSLTAMCLSTCNGR